MHNLFSGKQHMHIRRRPLIHALKVTQFIMTILYIILNILYITGHTRPYVSRMHWLSYSCGCMLHILIRSYVSSAHWPSCEQPPQALRWAASTGPQVSSLRMPSCEQPDWHSCGQPALTHMWLSDAGHHLDILHSLSCEQPCLNLIWISIIAHLSFISTSVEVNSKCKFIRVWIANQPLRLKLWGLQQ